MNDNSPELRRVLLTDAEFKYLTEGDDAIRCESCNHLEAFHNSHCCTYCMVDGCDCAWGTLGGYPNDR